MKINWENMPSGENKLSFVGEVGLIEAILHLPKENSVNNSRKAIAICCHPHPQFGGTMTNKVVHTVCKTFSNLGLPALRFNFRGIGQSEGSYDEGQGESKDLLILCEIMKESWPEHQLWLAGFSFGSWIAARSAVSADAKQLLSIAPPVQYFDFNQMQMPDCPWLVLMGEEDEVVEPEVVFNWIEAQSNPPALIRFPQTGHFFHGQLVNMRNLLEKHYENA